MHNFANKELNKMAIFIHLLCVAANVPAAFLVDNLWVNYFGFFGIGFCFRGLLTEIINSI